MNSTTEKQHAVITTTPSCTMSGTNDKKPNNSTELQVCPMVVPPVQPNCPPGLEYLTAIDQILIQQKIELLEVITGCETKNKYIVRNSLGQQIYYAKEDSDCCMRYCFGQARPLMMKIYDNSSNEIMNMYRPLSCQGCCFPCCLQSMEVYGPPGNLLGTVEQDWSIITPKFSIKNASGDAVLKIRGPCCVLKCCSDVDFNVLSVDGVTRVGRITKQWTGIAQELLTDADNFGITFPLDLSVEIKAVLFGACFLIDMMYFEHSDSILS